MNPNSMDVFALPVSAFDVSLLPESARSAGTKEFRDAVAAFFESWFRELGVNGQVVTTPETIHVTWARPGADPIETGIEMLRRGQVREGCQRLDLLRARFPDSVKLLLNLGMGWSDLGQLDRAIDVLRRVVALDPLNHRGRIALGVALGRQGDVAKALAELTRVVHEAPDDVWGRKNLGGLLLRQGQAADAVVHLEAAVKRDPSDGHAWLLLGEALLATQNPARARDALHRARRLTTGSMQDAATTLLNRATDTGFTRDADGLRPEVIDGLAWAIRTLDAIHDPEARRMLFLRAALLAQGGIDLKSREPVHALEGYEHGPLSGLQVACLIHAGVQTMAPGADTGLDWRPEHDVAVERASRR